MFIRASKAGHNHLRTSEKNRERQFISGRTQCITSHDETVAKKTNHDQIHIHPYHNINVKYDAVILAHQHHPGPPSVTHETALPILDARLSETT